jgi:hypothetical protein
LFTAENGEQALEIFQREAPPGRPVKIYLPCFFILKATKVPASVFLLPTKSSISMEAG